MGFEIKESEENLTVRGAPENRRLKSLTLFTII